MSLPYFPVVYHTIMMKFLLNYLRSTFEKAEESGAEVRDGVSALSCTEQDGFVEVSLHGEINYMESARYVLDCEGVVGTLKRQIIGKVRKNSTPICSASGAL